MFPSQGNYRLFRCTRCVRSCGLVESIAYVAGEGKRHTCIACYTCHGTGFVIASPVLNNNATRQVQSIPLSWIAGWPKKNPLAGPRFELPLIEAVKVFKRFEIKPEWFKNQMPKNRYYKLLKGNYAISKTDEWKRYESNIRTALKIVALVKPPRDANEKRIGKLIRNVMNEFDIPH